MKFHHLVTSDIRGDDFASLCVTHHAHDDSFSVHGSDSNGGVCIDMSRKQLVELADSIDAELAARDEDAREQEHLRRNGSA